MNKFEYKSDVSLSELVDELTGTTLHIGAHHGLIPDNSTLTELRQALKKSLTKHISENTFVNSQTTATPFLI